MRDRGAELFLSMNITCIRNIPYICSMRKEFGKWLMDIAKYMTTALLLSSVFGDMENPWIMGTVIGGAILTLLSGLWLVKDKKVEN